MKNAKEIEDLPLVYRGFTIYQDSKSVIVEHPHNQCLNYTERVWLNRICIAKNDEKKIYNKTITKKKTLLCAFNLSEMTFHKIEKAKKEIDLIIQMGYYWMELTPREQKYIRATYSPSDYIIEKE